MNQQSNKEWYKKWWGIIIAVLFLPFFIIWYAWAKSNWSKNVKIGVTVAASVFILIGLVSNGSNNKTAITPNKSATSQKSSATKQDLKPAFVYDVPALFGKNIDEVRAILGTPNDKDPEPNAQQLQLGTHEWDNEFKKDNLALLVTFDPNTRKVTDFFLSGNDKTKLMEQGNLKEGQSSYSIKQVKALKGGGITGIIVTAN